MPLSSHGCPVCPLCLSLSFSLSLSCCLRARVCVCVYVCVSVSVCVPAGAQGVAPGAVHTMSGRAGRLSPLMVLRVTTLPPLHSSSARLEPDLETQGGREATEEDKRE